jgi:hypothetical protein
LGLYSFIQINAFHRISAVSPNVRIPAGTHLSGEDTLHPRLIHQKARICRPLPSRFAPCSQRNG